MNSVPSNSLFKYQNIKGYAIRLQGFRIDKIKVCGKWSVSLNDDLGAIWLLGYMEIF